MTIIEQINYQRKPYKIASYGFGILAVVALAGGVALFWQCFVTQRMDTQPDGLSWAINIGWLIGFFGWYAAMLIPFFTLRCPKCRMKIGPPRKNWLHCPCCGIRFTEEIST